MSFAGSTETRSPSMKHNRGKSVRRDYEYAVMMFQIVTAHYKGYSASVLWHDSLDNLLGIIRSYS